MFFYSIYNLIIKNLSINISEVLKMVDLSHLFSLADFSLIDFIFGDNKSKKKKIQREEDVNYEKSFKDNDRKNINIINELSEKEKKLLIANYIFIFI